MCAVILIHCQAQGNSVADEYYQIILRQIINFAVATFIFMAGYFAHPYKIRGGRYWNRLKKLLIPYIIWSTFYSVLSSSDGLDPLRIIYHLITGKAQAQLYYIIVLLELTLLTPFLIKALDSRKWSVFIMSLTPIYLLLCSGYRYYTGAELSWMGRDFCAWIIFYYFGMLVKHYGWKRISNLHLIPMYFAALAVSITEGFIVNFKQGMFSMAISQIDLTTMLYSLTVIALIMNYWTDLRVEFSHQNEANRTNSNRFKSIKEKVISSLVYIGDISFGIYFCHTFVLRCVTFGLRRIGVMEISSLPLIQFLQFSLTLICSMIGIYIVQRVDAKRKLCPYIGF